MTDKPELEPCPFCGGAPQHTTDDEAYGYTKYGRAWFCVWCDTCGISIQDKEVWDKDMCLTGCAEKDSFKAWNTRPTPESGGEADALKFIEDEDRSRQDMQDYIDTMYGGEKTNTHPWKNQVETIRAALTAQSKPVDVDALKRYTDLRDSKDRQTHIDGYNRAIDHLHAQGYLSQPKEGYVHKLMGLLPVGHIKITNLDSGVVLIQLYTGGKETMHRGATVDEAAKNAVTYLKAAQGEK